MNGVSWRWLDLPFFRQGPFDMVCQALLLLAGLVAALAIVADFLRSPSRKAVLASRKSLVATGTMSLFFGFFAVLCLGGWGALPMPGQQLEQIVSVAGLVLIYLGLAINLAGRRSLGRMWGNQIVIWRDHHLVDRGVYRHIRHPLYASTILMLLGLALVYHNLAVVLLDLGAFGPFMVWRVRQEEAILLAHLPDYAAYRQRTGMFLPARRRRKPPTEAR
jgi:protein-S-isoprenylcysteine O-methyltransferase Ste14